MTEKNDGIFRGFAPVYGPHSRALILGSWPSPQSRAVGFYYGHPRNRFWPLLAALSERPLPQTIEEKKQLILDCGLALWDSLAGCEIVGARDETIRNPQPNDIAGLLKECPVQAVFCNGAASHKVYTKYILPITGVEAVRLPSTSPANAACGMEKLLIEWGRELGPWIQK